MMSCMGGNGRGRGVISPVTVAALSIAIGLVGNLATSTVQVRAGWWAPLTWTATGLLVVAAVVSQVAQPRDAGSAKQDQGGARTEGAAGTATVERCDPIALGVHPAIALDEHADSPGLSPKLPTYVRRDHDRLLGRLLEDTESPVFVLLVGTSSTGKTRSAYEAVRGRLPGWRLLHPFTAAELRAFLEAGIGPRTVLWLNESQTHLDGSEGETAAAHLRRLLASATQVVVIGSMWPQYWFAYTRTPRPGTPDPHRQVRALLETATKVNVPDAFAPHDLAGVRDLAKDDPRLASALTGLAQGFGVTQTLAGGPDLISRWENAPDAYRRAVIHAGVDARRLGHLGPLPAALLRALGIASLTGTELAAAPAGWFDDALAYACENVRGGVALLTATSRAEGRVDGYLLADFIDQHGREVRRPVPVPDAAWQALAARSTDPADLERLGASAMARGRHGQALALWRAALERGGVSAAAPLRVLLGQLGLHEEAEEVLRRAAGSGDAESQRLLLAVLRRANRGREVEQVLRRAAAAGDGQAGRDLGVLLHNSGRGEEAKTLLRTAADEGDRAAGRLLALLLQRSGRAAEAARIRRGLDEPAAVPADRPDEKSPRRGFDREMRATTAFPEAMTELLRLLRLQIGRGRADRLLRRSMAAPAIDQADGVDGRPTRLIRLLGHPPPLRDRAIAALDGVRADPGRDPALARLLVKLLIKADRRAEAETILRRLADLDYRALTDLVALLEDSSRREDCVPLLRAVLDVHGAKARYLLAAVLGELGHAEEADRLLRSAADEGIDAAVQRLVRLLLAGNRPEEAVEIIRRAARAGRSDSVRRAAIRLYTAGHEEETVSLLREAVVCGNAGTFRLLVNLLERMGRTDEAAAVARRGLAADGSTAAA